MTDERARVEAWMQELCPHWDVEKHHTFAVKKPWCIDCIIAYGAAQRAEAEGWDIRKWLNDLKESGLDGLSHEDGWTLMTTETANALRARRNE